VLIGLDEAHLEDVFGHVRAAGHAQRVTVQGVAVAADEDPKSVAMARENSLNDQLIGVFPVRERGVGSVRDGFRRLHDERVTHFPITGQYVRRVNLLE
jgi:hypothetical protein